MLTQNLATPSGGAPAESRGQATSVRWALAGLSLSMLMPSLDTSICNVALPTLSRTFSASFQQVQWVVLAYLLAITSLIVSVGRLGDLVGRRRLLQSGLAVFIAASILCGAAPSLWLLMAARAVQGLGAAVMMALTIALVGEAVPKERTGSAMGLLGTMSAVGTALGPSLGGFLLAGFGWRAIFFVNVPLGLLALVLVARFLPLDHERPKPRVRFDGLGTWLFAGALAAYALAVTLGRGHFDRLSLVLLLAAGLGGILFVLAEKRAASPLVRLDLFRNAGLSISLVQNALVATVMMATLVVGPFFLSRALGLSEAAVGMAMSFGPLISILSGVPAGRIVDRLGAPFMAIAALMAMVVGAMALSVLPARFGVAGYLAAIAVLTPGYQLFQAANNTSVMMDVPPDQRGVISGMLSLSRNLGLITGASVLGAVFAAAESAAAGLRATFTLAAALIAASIVLAIGSRRPSSRLGQRET